MEYTLHKRLSSEDCLERGLLLVSVMDVPCAGPGLASHGNVNVHIEGGRPLPRRSARDRKGCVKQRLTGAWVILGYFRS